MVFGRDKIPLPLKLSRRNILHEHRKIETIGFRFFTRNNGTRKILKPVTSQDSQTLFINPSLSLSLSLSLSRAQDTLGISSFKLTSCRGFKKATKLDSMMNGFWLFEDE
eukprot:TRINITY_DN4524_c1_g1_i2.p1 TRINITY_DN4524_c1_g1~~TRINITY_DN4524_c1_g1_i2.p1  ORF type:complete len:109 (-),score=6.20 TRINITY_DN4524_c1_g1_i2:109-435(-)